MKNNIKDLGVFELSELYRKKELSPVETVKVLLDEIEAKKDLNAFTTVMADEALKSARLSEERFTKGLAIGPLDGIPYAAKDIFYTSKAKTTMASRIYKDFQPTYNAHVIDKLENGGAILMGKTNTYEFACNPMADVSLFGPCKNPYDPERSACGSSGGSGSALAAHMVPVTLGSDTAGSVRIPAAACGVVGMRPTQGLVSRYGVFPLSYSIDNVGPMTRSVVDNAMVLEGMVGYDRRDERSINVSPVNYSSLLEDSCIAGMRFAVPEDFGTSNPIDPEIVGAFNRVLDILRGLGATVEFIPPLDPDGLNEKACRILRISDAYVVHERDMDLYGDIYTPEIYQQMQSGKNISASDYIKADRRRFDFRLKITELMTHYDVIITPTLPVLAPVLGTRTITIDGTDYSTTNMLISMTVLPSFTGFPAISIPCGFSESGLPIGVQLATGRLDELTAYQAAFALEKALNIPK